MCPHRLPGGADLTPKFGCIIKLLQTIFSSKFSSASSKLSLSDLGILIAHTCPDSYIKNHFIFSSHGKSEYCSLTAVYKSGIYYELVSQNTSQNHHKWNRRFYPLKYCKRTLNDAANNSTEGPTEPHRVGMERLSPLHHYSLGGLRGLRKPPHLKPVPDRERPSHSSKKLRESSSACTQGKKKSKTVENEHQ